MIISAALPIQLNMLMQKFIKSKGDIINMRKFYSILILVLLMIGLCSCVEEEGITQTAPVGEKISYLSEFYDNHGNQWLSVEGTSFSIQPNKVKEYAYDSSGSWISSWTNSSVMSITVDNQNIESCGSTVLFYDSRLQKLEIDIPTDITLSEENKTSIKTPYDGYNYWEDHWGLGYWYWTEKQANKTPASRVVIIQSQEGDPICMFAGNEVTWSVSRNLPKTTEVFIDGKVIYIHRSNFSIVDTSIFE